MAKIRRKMPGQLGAISGISGENPGNEGLDKPLKHKDNEAGQSGKPTITKIRERVDGIWTTRDPTPEEFDQMYRRSRDDLLHLLQETHKLVRAYGGPDEWDCFQVLRRTFEEINAAETDA
jgi:hypothetical protein